LILAASKYDISSLSPFFFKKIENIMGRKQLLLRGQRVFSCDAHFFYMCISHMPKKKSSGVKEYIVTQDCHVEKQAIDNVRVLLCPHTLLIDAKHDTLFTLDTQKNCGRRMFVYDGQPFYVSSGTSNSGDLNFKHVAFPFKGISLVGWFVKYYGSIESDWTKVLLETWDTPKLRLFFQRFETYQQLRVSALVKDRCDTFWDHNAALLKFVMRHEWNDTETCFEKARVPPLKLPQRNAKERVHLIFAHEHVLKINEWLGVF
jgi:hypothetical protein